MTKTLLTPADVAGELDLCTRQVHRLDGVLKPARTPTGMRIYDPEIVAAVKAERAAKRAAKRAPRVHRRLRIDTVRALRDERATP